MPRRAGKQYAYRLVGIRLKECAEGVNSGVVSAQLGPNEAKLRLIAEIGYHRFHCLTHLVFDTFAETAQGTQFANCGRLSKRTSFYLF